VRQHCTARQPLRRRLVVPFVLLLQVCCLAPYAPAAQASPVQVVVRLPCQAIVVGAALVLG
jgi:hypothetical protein